MDCGYCTSVVCTGSMVIIIILIIILCVHLAEMAFFFGPYMEMIVQELILENTHDVKKMGIQWSLNLNKGHIGNYINSAALSFIERLSSLHKTSNRACNFGDLEQCLL